MGKYFGTDGFRGEAGITLTADHAYKVGRFLGWYYNMLRERNGDTNPARIVIGKDTRRSSYMFEYSLVAGLTASGADAYLLHVTTTPSVAYIARVDDFDCGIMISASHNPYYDNGIKLIDCYGEKMPEETLLLVEDYIDGKLHVFDKDWPELPFAHREHIGCTVDYVAGRNRYMGYLISLGIYSFKGVKVGLDCANGASWNIVKSVFDALGADTYVINNQPNGLNINNNAGSTHIEGLQKFVVEKGLDVGFAYGGDADRCLCVDEKGNVITGDHILYIYGCYMKERGKLLTNTVVTTVVLITDYCEFIERYGKAMFKAYEKVIGMIGNVEPFNFEETRELNPLFCKQESQAYQNELRMALGVLKKNVFARGADAENANELVRSLEPVKLQLGDISDITIEMPIDDFLNGCLPDGFRCRWPSSGDPERPSNYDGIVEWTAGQMRNYRSIFVKPAFILH